MWCSDLPTLRCRSLRRSTVGDRPQRVRAACRHCGRKRDDGVRGLPPPDVRHCPGRRGPRDLGGGARAQPRSASHPHPGEFTAAEALHWGAIAEVVPQEKVQARAMELAEGLASRPQLLNRYLAMTIGSASAAGWQRDSPRNVVGGHLGGEHAVPRARLSVSAESRRMGLILVTSAGRPTALATMLCSASTQPGTCWGGSRRTPGSSTRAA